MLYVTMFVVVSGHSLEASVWPALSSWTKNREVAGIQVRKRIVMAIRVS